MMRFASYIGLLLLSPVLLYGQAPEHPWAPARIEAARSLDYPAIIHFNNGERLQTDLYNLTFIGILPTVTRPPYVVVSGFECTECDAGPMVVVHSAAEGPLQYRRAITLTFPGRVHDYETGRLVVENRLFYGECLDVGRVGVVLYGRRRTSGAAWSPHLYVYDLVADTLRAATVNPVDVSLDVVLGMVTAGRCTEIPPQDRPSDP